MSDNGVAPFASIALNGRPQPPLHVVIFGIFGPRSLAVYRPVRWWLAIGEPPLLWSSDLCHCLSWWRAATHSLNGSTRITDSCNPTRTTQPDPFVELGPASRARVRAKQRERPKWTVGVAGAGPLVPVARCAPAPEPQWQPSCPMGKKHRVSQRSTSTCWFTFACSAQATFSILESVERRRISSRAPDARLGAPSFVILDASRANVKREISSSRNECLIPAPKSPYPITSRPVATRPTGRRQEQCCSICSLWPQVWASVSSYTIN